MAEDGGTTEGEEGTLVDSWGGGVGRSVPEEEEQENAATIVTLDPSLIRASAVSLQERRALGSSAPSSLEPRVTRMAPFRDRRDQIPAFFRD